MMSQSQSQLSDFVSSFYDDQTNELTYLGPSNPPTTPLGSQTTTTDLFHPDFTRPSVPITIPSFFLRVGPNRRKDFVLYDKMAHTEWVEWWLQTDYGRKSKINWDASHGTQIWENFDQVASAQDGTPKIMCRRCAKILEHPYTLRVNLDGRSQYHGTSGMSKHWKSNACVRYKGTERQKTDITQFLKTGVSIPTILQDISINNSL
jgi:hypothetical protein